MTPRVYGCAFYHKRGVCENSLSQRVEAVDAAVLGALERERAGLQRKIGRMVAAIGDGKGPAALVQEIGKAEARITENEADLARLASAPALGDLDLTQIEPAVAEQLERFLGYLKGNVPRARQVLKKLLKDKLAFRPVDVGKGKRTYAFTGELSYGAVLREIVYLESVPRGICTLVAAALAFNIQGMALVAKGRPR
jgi:hypothetical protein